MLELPFGEIDLSGQGAELEGGASVLATGWSGRTTINIWHLGQGPALSGGRCDLTEPLGDITVLGFDPRGAIVKMVLPEDRALAIKPGQAVEVVIAARNLHLFDRDTGRRID